MLEPPKVGDEVYIKNVPQSLRVLLVAPESNIFVTDKHVKYKNGYQTNQFPFNTIIKLIRDIDYIDISER